MHEQGLEDVNKKNLEEDEGTIDQHGGDSSEHIPGSVENVELIGRLDLPRTNGNPGIITDIWSHGNYAYLGTFSPPCGALGVYVVDISDPADPQKVRFLPSRPGSRVNDVKVFHFDNLASGFSGDLLLHSNEICSNNASMEYPVSVGDTVDNSDGSTLARARPDPACWTRPGSFLAK